MPIMKFAVLLQMLFVPAMCANLLTNGGFENPNLTGNKTNEIFDAGSSGIPGWLVTPFAPADVAIVRDNYTTGGLSFLPHSGSQSLNITGDFSGEAAGVVQDVKLQVGDQYELTFWVGNQDNNAPDFAMDATVAVYIDGQFANSYTNGNSSRDALNWKQFSLTFTAAKTNTSIQFENFTLPNEDYIGLDDANLVDLTPHADAPEPATLWLMGLALSAAGVVGRQRRGTK
jgi:hypothetical protein